MTKTEARKFAAQAEKELGVESANLIGFSEDNSIKYWGVSVRRAGGESIVWAIPDPRDVFQPLLPITTAQMMTAQDMGRKGGSAKTDAKKAASAENGKKGGRPKALKTVEPGA